MEETDLIRKANQPKGHTTDKRTYLIDLMA